MDKQARLERLNALAAALAVLAATRDALARSGRIAECAPYTTKIAECVCAYECAALGAIHGE